MMAVCFAHNYIDAGQGWQKPRMPVEELVTEINKPFTIGKCPDCLAIEEINKSYAKAERIEKMLSMPCTR